MRTGFLAQQYARRCPAGDHYIDPPRYEWDETPRFEFCPFDGLPLELLACPSCAAPLAIGHGSWGTYIVLACCPYCGESARAPRETQRVERWVPKIEIPPSIKP